MDANAAHPHYLPHHAIVRTDHDTTKLRVVYDASAKLDSQPSLNDCLYVGRKFNQKIFNLLVRFRSYPIGLTADIKKAFLMIGVEEGDRDALRFLWVNNVDDEEPAIRPLRFIQVVFGVCSSPLLLNSTIQHHLEWYQLSHPLLVKKLIESLYVDDVVTGEMCEEEARQIPQLSKSNLIPPIGPQETLTEVRTRFWIVKGRSLVRRIIHRCVTCCRFEGKPFPAPTPPPCL